MRFSAKAEYACIAMVELASRRRNGQPVQIKSIAEAHAISPRFLVQILLQLKGAGFVTSTRGAAGGYILTRPPETVSLADIIDCIDQLPAIDKRDVSRSSVLECLREVWREINEAERRILENTTISELLVRAQARDASSYQI